MKSSSFTRPIRPWLLIALVATALAPEINRKAEDRATAAPATSGPIILTQRCYRVDGQLRCV